ncbi:MAG: exo-alpha-sialidase [Planctomycetes bacterium]|nr:exo-alpha-sialidase [Planctomycetota bacterium]
MKSRRLLHHFIVVLTLSIGASSSIMAQVMTGPDVNVSDMAGYQGEVGVALNPTNPLNIVVVTNELTDLTKLGVWYSLDGGATWTANFVDENADGLDPDDIRFDPNVAFDSDGNVYIVYSMSGPPSRVVLTRSSDGGQHYHQSAIVTTDPSSSRLHTAMVTTRSADGADAVLVVYARVHPPESIEAALSLNAGASFTVHSNFINEVLQRTFLPWAVADTAGNFHVVWEVELNNSGTGIIQHDVLDGVTLANSHSNTTVTTIQITDFAAPTSEIPAQPDRGLFSVATVDVDRATGRLYLTYTDRINTATDDTDIYVRYSDSNGADWSDRIKVNDDHTTTSQFMPRIAVDQTTGTLVAIWYDARNDVATNGLVDIYTSVSHDGAASWSRNQQVTTAQSDESVNNPQRDSRNYLEYIGLSVHDGVAHVSWTDARDDNFNAGTNEDIYSAAIYIDSPCPWDLDGSGSVGTNDLLALFAQWGTAGPADFDESGVVDTNDLLILFANWGPCP